MAKLRRMNSRQQSKHIMVNCKCIPGMGHNTMAAALASNGGVCLPQAATKSKVSISCCHDQTEGLGLYGVRDAKYSR
eukprot:6179760-Pleurochrysis_carterae.AAC.4